MGIFFGVGAFTAPLLSLLFGRLGDKYSRKAVLLLTLAFLPIATAMLLITRYYPLLLLAAAWVGLVLPVPWPAVVLVLLLRLCRRRYLPIRLRVWIGRWSTRSST
nr:hypothetical protein [Vulcanisaeta sp. JCM 14467]